MYLPGYSWRDMNLNGESWLVNSNIFNLSLYMRLCYHHLMVKRNNYGAWNLKLVCWKVECQYMLTSDPMRKSTWFWGSESLIYLWLNPKANKQRPPHKYLAKYTATLLHINISISCAHSYCSAHVPHTLHHSL